MGPQAHFANRSKCGLSSLANGRCGRHERPARSLEHDGYRAVVDELDGHARTEDPGLNGNPFTPQRRAKVLVERLGLLGASGVAEARAVALPRVGDQRELADDERRAADVEDAPVEPSLLVPEDAKPRDLCGEVLRCRVVIGTCDPEQHDQAHVDLPADVIVDAHTRGRNSLADRPHAALPNEKGIRRSIPELFELTLISTRARGPTRVGVLPTTHCVPRYRGQAHVSVTILCLKWERRYRLRFTSRVAQVADARRIVSALRAQRACELVMTVRLRVATLLFERASQPVVRVVIGRRELEHLAELLLRLGVALDPQIRDSERFADRRLLRFAALCLLQWNRRLRGTAFAEMRSSLLIEVVSLGHRPRRRFAAPPPGGFARASSEVTGRPIASSRPRS